MSDPWKKVAASVTELALSLAVLYMMTPDSNIQAWRYTSRVFQAVARRFGIWGMRAEAHYLNLAEENRMI